MTKDKYKCDKRKKQEQYQSPSKFTAGIKDRKPLPPVKSEQRKIHPLWYHTLHF